MYTYVQRVADLHGIEAVFPRQKILPKHFDKAVVLDSIGRRTLPSTSDEYKWNLYYPALDAFNAELSRHFDSKNIELIHAIQACEL